MADYPTEHRRRGRANSQLLDSRQNVWISVVVLIDTGREKDTNNHQKC